MSTSRAVAVYALGSGIALLSSAALACSCLYQGVFPEYSAKNPVVIRGTPHFSGPSRNDRPVGFMSVEVTEVLKGQFDHGKVFLQGGDGLSCAKTILQSEYPEGSEHLFILANSNERQTLLGCGEVSMAIDGDEVVGHRPFPAGQYEYRMPLSQLLADLRSQ